MSTKTQQIRAEIAAQQDEIDGILDELGDQLEDAASEVQDKLDPKNWIEARWAWVLAGGMLGLWGLGRLVVGYFRRRDLEAALRQLELHARGPKIRLALPRAR